MIVCQNYSKISFFSGKNISQDTYNESLELGKNVTLFPRSWGKTLIIYNIQYTPMALGGWLQGSQT